jgi:hypothetical protein
MKRILAISLGTTLAHMPMSANAAPDKAQYELQERCAKRAEQLFAKSWPKGSPDNSAGYTITGDYVSHYNARLNKCFMLETAHSYDKNRPTVSKTLLDVNSNKQYGAFIGDLSRSINPSGLALVCYFGEKRCGSEAEWDAMADVYMEEDGTGNK